MFPFIAGKAFAFRILVGIAFIAWLILAIRRPEFRPKKNCILLSLILFLIVIGIANILGQNPYQSFWSIFERMEGYVTMLHLFAFFLVATSLIKTKKTWFNILAASTFISIIMIWLGFAQLANPETISQGNRLDATFGNPIYLAIYNLFHIFFALILIFNRDYFQKNWQKIIFGVIGFLHLIILYFTITRGAVLGLMVGIFVVVLLNIILIKKASPKIWKTSLFALIAGIILLALFFSFKESNFVQSSPLLSRFAEINLQSGTSGARILNWQIAWEGFQKKPILGYGMGNYSVVYDKYYNPALHGNEAWFDHTHNIVFDWLIAGGLLGLLAYLLLFLALFSQIYKSENYSLVEKNLFVGLMVAYFAQNLFVFDSQITYLSFFLVLAIFANEKAKEINVFKVEIQKTTQNILIVAILTVGLYGIYQLNTPGYFAGKSIINSLTASGIAGQMINANVNPQEVQKRIDSAISEMKKAISYNSFGNYEIIPRAVDLGIFIASIDPKYYPVEKRQEYLQYAFDQLVNLADIYSYDAKAQYLAGIYFSRFRDFQNSLKYFNRMLEVSPNKQVTRIPVAQVYFNMKDPEKALAFAKETFELDSSKADLWVEYYNLALKIDQDLSEKIFQEEGDEEKYLELEKRFVLTAEGNPNPQNYINLSAFYFKIGQKEKSIETLNQAKELFQEFGDSFDQAIKQIQAGENPIGQKF